MGQGYTRNDGANNIANGNVIDAADLDGEFDAIVSSFAAATGHTHDGTAAEGGAITLVGPVQEYIGDGVAWYPKADATYDIGKAAASFKVAYVEDINLGGTLLTASGTEINYTDGVTSAIQTQLNNKQPLDADLTAIAALANTDGNFIVGNGTAWVVENGATVRTTLGLGSAALTASTAYATSTQGATADAALSRAGGTMTGNITMPALGTVDGVDISVRDGVLSTTTTTANAALPKAGGTMTGNITMPALGTVDGVDISVRDGVLSTTTTTANAALPKAGGTMTGNITMPALGTVDGRDLSVDGAKLDLIEANADVTDTANVTAAGALMDSEVDADIKTLVLPASTTISTYGASLVDDITATAARTTLGLGTAATTASTAYATDAQGTKADSALQAASTLDATKLSGILPALDGSGLTSLTSANLTGALPAIDGSALTGISSAPTTAQVGTATAGLAAGDVGTYMWARGPGSSTAAAQFNFGSTYAGSGLYPAGFAAESSDLLSGTWYYRDSSKIGIGPDITAARSGTWRCMGQTPASTFDENPTVLFLRIS